MTQFKYPVVPATIDVHLGMPDQAAENITVSFPYYIKNVASSEIYPTWPENAIRANVYAQISYALNRIYTEWYPTQGYDFDITNTTQFDQAFQPGRSINENINRIVDDIFNDYVTKGDGIEPFFTQYCNGTTSTCPGLSQWGTVALAEQGLTPYEILQYYYGNDINIIEDAPVQDALVSYPGEVLKLGMRRNDIKIIQSQLNRIRQNYPAIPPIRYVDGVYDTETQEAVRTFQRINQLPQTGEVDKATWYKIKRIYTAVKKLGELNSEGVQAAEVAPVVITELRPGAADNDVKALQYYLAVIGYFEPSIPVINVDGIYGPQTETAVKLFQGFVGLPVTGIVDQATWTALQQDYDEIVSSLPPEFYGSQAKLYPGYILKIGMENSDVTDLQTYLLKVSEVYDGIPPVEVTGYFDESTQQAVEAFQRTFGLPVQGIVGPATWEQLAEEYNKIV